MCGIWALINLKERLKIDVAKYLPSYWSINRRGPDFSCFQTHYNTCVGFHRLAIMDDSFASNQPYVITSAERTIVYIMNGEIYNYKDLIQKYNLKCNKTSDCMTVLELYDTYTKVNPEAGYKEWTKLFDTEIKGEFAFILLEFDTFHQLRKVVIGRDQIGVRPLYYHPYIEDVSTSLIFTSEIKGATSFEGKVEEFPPGTIS